MVWLERFLMEDLVAWKDSAFRKPLLLNGARQVGKTWLLQEFGRRYFKNVARVNFDNNAVMATRFDEGYNVKRLLRAISAETGQPIQPHETLVILDEIQECPKAITSLKYFCEDAPEYAIAAAGSLLGISIGRSGGTGYPVGKVETKELFPLSFREFLDAMGERQLRLFVDEGEPEAIDGFAPRLVGLLRQYFVVGGMPETVAQYVTTNDIAQARAVQDRIIEGYERDLAKHLSGRIAEHTFAAWRSVPAHLGSENKRFIFSRVRQSGRGRDYEEGITWLTEAGLCTKVARVAEPRMPLAAYAEDSMFKLFVVDVGLLGQLSGLEPRAVLEDEAVFHWFRGALTEQFVCQQLVSDFGTTPFYWTPNDASSESDFLFQHQGGIYLVEVKSGTSLASASLSAIAKRFNWLKAVRLSLAGFRDQGRMRNIPLYAMGSRPLWGFSAPKTDVGDVLAASTTLAGTGQAAEDEKLNTLERALVDLLRESPRMTYDELAQTLGVSRATVARAIRRLRGARIIVRKGNPRTGQWRVLR